MGKKKSNIIIKVCATQCTQHVHSITGKIVELLSKAIKNILTNECIVEISHLNHAIEQCTVNV